MLDALKRLAAFAVLILLLAAALWGVWRLARENAALRERHENNVMALTAELELGRFHDSLATASARAMELRAREAERLCGKLNGQLRDLRIKMRDARTASSVETIITDTVFFPLPSETEASRSDTCLSFSDPWVSLDLCKEGGEGSPLAVSYSVRDSVTTVVHVRYRRRFLFFRWKPEYRATSVCANPHAHIRSAAAVVVTE